MQAALSQIQADIRQYQPAATLVAVTKNASLAQMREAFALGVRHFGENKVQDALDKMAALPPDVMSAVQWHLIGHLQSNKVNKAVGRFQLIESVDSLALAKKIARRAQALDIVQDVLLQVNIAEEPQKSGFSLQALRADFAAILALSHLRVRGLMTIAPAGADAATLARVFGGLQNLMRDCRAEAPDDCRRHGFSELSMGMSEDYVHALQSGATIIRLGRLLLGTSSPGFS